MNKNNSKDINDPVKINFNNYQLKYLEENPVNIKYDKNNQIDLSNIEFAHDNIAYGIVNIILSLPPVSG